MVGVGVVVLAALVLASGNEVERRIRGRRAKSVVLMLGYIVPTLVGCR